MKCTMLTRYRIPEEPLSELGREISYRVALKVVQTVDGILAEKNRLTSKTDFYVLFNRCFKYPFSRKILCDRFII